MTNKNNGNEKDFVMKPVVRKSKDVPLLPLGKGFKERSHEEQVKYLHKLASSYHWTANQIQKERDELNTLVFQKEAQLVELKKAREADQRMIHRQLATANKEKQGLLQENQNLYAEIKALKE